MVFDVTIREYLKEIDESPLLSWDEEKELGHRVMEYNDPEAREKLVCSNLRLVVNIAKDFSRRGMPLGDLIEEGNIGLIRAVDSFDPDYEVRFSTYAAWWIKQSIKRALLSSSQPIHIPTYMVELINQWRYTYVQLESKLDREPELEEMAAEMNLPLKKAKAVKDIYETVDAGFKGESEEDGAGLKDTLQDDRIGSPEEVLANEEELGKAIRLLSDIEPRAAKILMHRFGIEGHQMLTLKEIGEEIGLTRERVRQIQRTALTQLNELMMMT